MSQMNRRTFPTQCSSVALGVLPAIAGFAISSPPAVAQGAACQPPQAGEFLLLVVSRTRDDQAKVRSVLPSNANATVCSYFQDTVVRIGGFRSLESATSWSTYMGEKLGLQAFVARPSSGAVATQPWGMQSNPAPANNYPANPYPNNSYPNGRYPANPYPPNGYPSNGYPTNGYPTTSYPANTPPATYNPQLLGGGFAVIVQFNSRPEVAMQVRQVLNREIGLAAYEQRPYLLAVHTSNQRIAESILRSLTERGFSAAIVDSRQVVLLKPAVNVPANVGGF